MINQKHTPGPWTVCRTEQPLAGNDYSYTNYRVYFNKTPVQGGQFCEVYGADREMNAKLITKAPELLEAAEEALGVLTEHCLSLSLRFTDMQRSDIKHAVAYLQAVIAKSKGLI